MVLVFVLHSPLGKMHQYAFRLEFQCTSNIEKFDALLLGTEQDLTFGCKYLTIFGDFELIINLIKNIYSPSNKLIKSYTQIVW